MEEFRGRTGYKSLIIPVRTSSKLNVVCDRRHRHSLARWVRGKSTADQTSEVDITSPLRFLLRVGSSMEVLCLWASVCVCLFPGNIYLHYFGPTSSAKIKQHYYARVRFCFYFLRNFNKKNKWVKKAWRKEKERTKEERTDNPFRIMNPKRWTYESRQTFFFSPFVWGVGKGRQKGVFVHMYQPTKTTTVSQFSKNMLISQQSGWFTFSDTANCYS